MGGWVVGSAGNRASSAPIELGLGLSLATILMGFDTNDTNLVKFPDGKWNFPNRKLDYFSHFQAPDQRTSFIKRFSFGPRFSKSIFKTGKRPILTYLDPS